MKQQESPLVEERNKRSLAFQAFATGDWKYFHFFSSYILFSLFSSLYCWDLKLFFTLSQKLFPSIVRLHKWEIRSEDSSKLRFQIATFLRFSCRNLQLSLGSKRFRRGQLHDNMHHHQPQTFCPTFLLYWHFEIW